VAGGVRRRRALIRAEPPQPLYGATDIESMELRKERLKKHGPSR
jgi:hypothetical protein